MKLHLKGRRWPLIIGILAIVLIAGLVGGVWAVRSYYQNNLKAVSDSQTAVIVTIPEGSTVNEIAKILKEKQLIRNSSVFTQYIRSQGDQDKLQAGTYSLRPSQSVEEIAVILTKGNILENLFTILPGKRLDEIKSAMINAGFNAEEVEQAFDPALYANHPALVDKPAAASLEGYLYPDSYQKVAETKPQTIIKQSLDEMQSYLTPEIRNAFVAQGLTLHQGVTLASIVSKEVSKPADKPVVAQVFLKRLRMGMLLQSDVATIYGDILAGHEPSTTFDTPYNVYIHPGLPIGPISNVTNLDLQAVANPAKTDWLYFVAQDDSDITHFSNTVEEHEALVDQYCKKQCR